MNNHINLLRAWLLAMVAYLVGEGLGVVILAICLEVFGVDVMRSLTAVPFVVGGVAAGWAAGLGYSRKNVVTAWAAVLIALVVPVLISITMVISATVEGAVNTGNVVSFAATQIAAAAVVAYAVTLRRARRAHRNAQASETLTSAE